MTERQKVLLATYDFPYPPNTGSRIRDHNLLREISRSVTVYPSVPVNEEAIPDLSELRKFCAQIIAIPALLRSPFQKLVNSIRYLASAQPIATHRYFYPEMALAIRSIIDDEGIDILQIEPSFLAACRDPVPEGARCRTILSLHNVGSRQYRRIGDIQKRYVSKLFYLLEASLIARSEAAQSVARFDHCLAVSDEDARLLDDALPLEKLSVVENGVDCWAMRQLVVTGSGADLLFTGVMGYPPNTMRWCTSASPFSNSSATLFPKLGCAWSDRLPCGYSCPRSTDRNSLLPEQWRIRFLIMR
jgi:hypothetical protein